jgi:heat shock protein HslJ
VRLGETSVQAAEKQREPHLIFARDQLSVSGSGCNRVTGSFELDGDKLRLRGMAGTMMACPAGMEQEQRFLQSLQKWSATASVAAISKCWMREAR